MAKVSDPTGPHSPVVSPLALAVAAVLGAGACQPSLAVNPAVYHLESVAVEGQAVPGGTPGEVITKLDIPAITDAGYYYFRYQTVDTAKVHRDKFVSGGSNFSVESTLLEKGDPVQGALSNTSVVKSFKTPAVNTGESFAGMTMLTGAGNNGSVTSANDAAIMFQVPGGALKVIAQEGVGAFGADGRYKSFGSVAIGDDTTPPSMALATFGALGPITNVEAVYGTVFYTGRLFIEGTVTKFNDEGLWAYSMERGHRLVLREGDTLDVNGTNRVVKSFKTLVAAAPATGGGHSVVRDGCVALLKFKDGAAAIAQLNANPLVPSFYPIVTGDAPQGLPTATYKSFGVASGHGGPPMAFAKVSDGSFRIASFLGGGTENVILDSHLPVAGHPLAFYKSVKDPVANVDDSCATFAKLKGTDASGNVITTANDDVVVAALTIGSEPVVIAREGDLAPGAGAATFGKFKSLMLPDGAHGVIIDATLAINVNGVTSANDEGLWAWLPTSGFNGGPLLQPLVREGDVVNFGSGSETVTKINAFKAVVGSADQQRSGNASGQVLFLMQTRVGTNKPRNRVMKLTLGSSMPL